MIKEARKIYLDNYYKSPKEKRRQLINSKNKGLLRDKRLNRFFELYTNKKGCNDCGIIGPRPIYEFNHIDGSTIATRKSEDSRHISIYYGAYGLKLKQWFKQIRRCEIICSNCHSIKSHNMKVKFNNQQRG